jgi:hypothetical protein
MGMLQMLISPSVSSEQACLRAGGRAVQPVKPANGVLWLGLMVYFLKDKASAMPTAAVIL